MIASQWENIVLYFRFERNDNTHL